MDPLTLKDVIVALGPVLVAQPASTRRTASPRWSPGSRRWTPRCDRDPRSAVPEANRKLVTGHESLGYFAARYGFQLVGAIIPGLTTRPGCPRGARASSPTWPIDVEQRVKAIFTEIGTPTQVAEAIADETGVTRWSNCRVAQPARRRHVLRRSCSATRGRLPPHLPRLTRSRMSTSTG
jgi:zinc/manganese transport system substrate-binding protein